ncbi:MAG: iron ABC transporter permease [Treponema sp.]|jgi:iron(III) transport system permease protein|nr:iron ABC transporter permease [Treponema sp.]
MEIKTANRTLQFSPGGALIKTSILWVIAALLVYPNIQMIINIFYKEGGAGFTLEAFRKLLSSARAMRSIRNSFILAVSMVITVNISGTLLVFFTEYLDIKGAKILKLGYMSTLVYGGIVLCTGYKFVYGQNGIITHFLLNLFPNLNPRWFTGYFAVIFIQTFAGTSNHIVFLTNAIRGIDYQTIEAARNLGAPPLKIFIKVVLPVLRPTFFALTILTFIGGLSAVSAPLVVGGIDFQTINPMIIEFARAPFSRDIAALMSVILGTATMILLFFVNRFEKKGHYISISKVKSKLVKIKISNPILNWLAHGSAYLLFLIYITPIVLVILFSFSNSVAIMAGTLKAGELTLANYREFFTSPNAFKPFAVSTLYSATAAILVTLLVTVVSRVLHRGNSRLSPVFEYGMLIPWMLPATMIAMGLMTSYDTRRLLMFNRVLIGSTYILLIGYIIVKIPFSLRMVKASFFSVEKALEEAARSLGAGPFYTMIRVILPIILPTLLSVIALNLNSMLSEYDLTVFLYHPFMVPLGPIIKAASEEAASLNALAMSFVYAVMLMALSSLTLFLVYGKKPNLKQRERLPIE